MSFEGGVNGEKYTFGTNHRYLMISKLYGEIDKELTMGDYVKWFEANVINQSKGRE